MKSLFILTMLLGLYVNAGDINWSGKYQFEAVQVKNPSLDKDDSLSFMYHHLVLSPKIVAGDGLAVYSRFDIFNNSSYQNSQFGEFFGGSESSTTNRGATKEMDSETIAVNELYLTWSQQYGSLLVGRAPVQFGLGITHNAGNGEFDHWFDRKDLVGYKVIMGNFFFMPMYGKVKEGFSSVDDDIRQYLFQIGYENFDTDLEIGFFYENTKANPDGIDLTTTVDLFNVASVRSADQLDVKTYNLFIRKKGYGFTFGLEGSIQDGDTGLKTTSAVNAAQPGVKLDSTAIALELGYTKKDSKLKWDLKAGYIGGDDPNTRDTYEGYLIDRNYDIALLMFNYYLGQPFLGAASSRGFLGNENYVRGTTTAQDVDVGQITNTIYAAPGFSWNWSDKWGMTSRFIWAQLNKEQYTRQDKNLGYEIDLGFHYRPIEKFVVKLDLGYLMTGDAYKGDRSVSPSIKTDDAYGVFTKAALSF